MSRAGAIFNMGEAERKTPPGKHTIRRLPRVPRGGVFLQSSRKKRHRRIAESAGLARPGLYERILKQREKSKAARRARKKTRARAR